MVSRSLPGLSPAWLSCQHTVLMCRILLYNVLDCRTCFMWPIWTAWPLSDCIFPDLLVKPKLRTLLVARALISAVSFLGFINGQSLLPCCLKKYPFHFSTPTLFLSRPFKLCSQFVCMVLGSMSAKYADELPST